MSLEFTHGIFLILYIALTMLTVDFRLTWSQDRALSQHLGLIARTTLANIILAPLAAYILYRLIDVPVAYCCQSHICTAHAICDHRAGYGEPDSAR